MEVRKTWQDYSSLAKRKRALQRTTINKTGGGPIDTPFLQQKKKRNNCLRWDLWWYWPPWRSMVASTWAWALGRHLPSPSPPNSPSMPSLRLQLLSLQSQHRRDLRMSVVVVRVAKSWKISSKFRKLSRNFGNLLGILETFRDFWKFTNFWYVICEYYHSLEIFNHMVPVSSFRIVYKVHTSVVLQRKSWHLHYIYIYAFSRRFYPKRLTMHSSYSFYILSALAFPGNRTHDLGVASAMLYYLSYRKAAL